MSGPTFGQPTIDDVIQEAEAGTYTEPTAVWVLDSSEWVIVIPPSLVRPKPIVYKTRWVDITAYETTKADTEDEVDWSWSAPVISTVDDYESIPYIETESCGPVLASAVKQTNVGGTMPLKPFGFGVAVLPVGGAGTANTPNIHPMSATVAVVGGSSGSGRADNPNIAAFVAATGENVWTYTVPGGANTNACHTNGEELDALACDESGRSFAYVRSANGLNGATDACFLIGIDSDGNLLWSIENTSISTSGGNVCAANGKVLCRGPSGNTWTGGTAAQEFVLADAATGAVLATRDAVTTNNTRTAFSGATLDRILMVPESADDLLIVSATDLSTIATVTRASFATPIPTTLAATVQPYGDGWIIVSRSTVSQVGRVWFLAEDGTPGAEFLIDVTDVGSTPQIQDARVDASGRIWALIEGSTGQRVTRYSAPFTEPDWPVNTGFVGTTTTVPRTACPVGESAVVIGDSLASGNAPSVSIYRQQM